MHRTRALFPSAALLALVVLMAAPDRLPAQQGGQVAIDHDDIGGVVRSPNGPVFMTLLQKTFGKDITTRTWDTLTKCLK